MREILLIHTVVRGNVNVIRASFRVDKIEVRYLFFERADLSRLSLISVQWLKSGILPD